MENTSDSRETLIASRKYALYLLEQRDLTEKQLRDKLVRRGYSEAVAGDTIAYVKSFNYIDDLRYAKHYIEYRKAMKSRRKINEDLMKKGISRDIISVAMEDCGDWNEDCQIEALLKKKSYDSEMADTSEKRRVYGFLMRRGYQPDDIRRLMKM